MAINLSSLNISLDKFNAESCGTYNIGQMKLSSDGKSVYRTNNHKTFTILNRTELRGGPGGQVRVLQGALERGSVAGCDQRGQAEARHPRQRVGRVEGRQHQAADGGGGARSHRHVRRTDQPASGGRRERGEGVEDERRNLQGRGQEGDGKPRGGARRGQRRPLPSCRPRRTGRSTTCWTFCISASMAKASRLSTRNSPRKSLRS